MSAYVSGKQVTLRAENLRCGNHGWGSNLLSTDKVLQIKKWDCHSVLNNAEGDNQLRKGGASENNITGCSSVWLERSVWDREVAGSNPVIPTYRHIISKASYLQNVC